MDSSLKPFGLNLFNSFIIITDPCIYNLAFSSSKLFLPYIKSFPTCRTIEIIVQSGKIDICDCLIIVWRQRTMEQRVF